jgi:hypothetical protein
MSSAQYFHDLDIDPYEIVGVSRKCDKKTLKKAYLQKALICHPDKQGGKTTMEFKLLLESYNYIKNCLDGKIQDYTITPDFHASNYKENFKDNDQEEINYTRSKVNYNTERQYFVDHGLPQNVDDTEENLNKIFGQRNKISKEYNPSQYIKGQVNIFGHEGYDKDKFNAMFEIHKEQYGCNQAYEENEYDTPLGFDSHSTLQPLPILTHGGLIIDKPQKDIKLKFKEPASKQYTINEIKKNKQFKAKLNNIKKEEQPITQKEINKRIKDKKLNVDIKINTDINFQQANEKFYQEKVRKMKQEMENNKSIIQQYTQIYEPKTIEQYHQGLLQDSSTMIFAPNEPAFKDIVPPQKRIDRQFENVHSKQEQNSMYLEYSNEYY